ncbi:MAG: glutathione S-transferase family protein [Alphaproteobacteria bacterium]|nr:glutathione S-transferase family protein [Alphaproteobacteria bacterium]
MPDFKIVLGNKNYSSWSLRPWLALKQTGAAFDEIVIPLDEPQTKEQILRHSPSGKVPALVHGSLTVWDSLAICEYLAEQFPAAGLWPVDPAARAVARSAAAEMHSGFVPLRQALPMIVRRTYPAKPLAPDVQENVNRITAIWLDCRTRFGSKAEGPFLFGAFSIADAMYAPVVTRFRTYSVDLTSDAAAYVKAVWETPSMQEWIEAAKREPWINTKYETD